VTVRQYNNFVRKVLYGIDSGQDFLTGEILMMKEPFILKSPTGITSVIADNSEEFIVVSKMPTQDGISFQDGDITHVFQFKSYDVLAKSLATDRMVNLKVLQPVDENKYKSSLQQLVALAKGNKFFWKYYFQLKDMFAKAEYAYSITAHKSQGSTFNKVFVIRKDINLNKNVVERNQCLYVAISRCREFAGIL
jgi:exodeoxyribonuclease-5